MPADIGTTPSEALRLAEAARQAHDEALSPHGGFLPSEIPLTSLPGPLARYVDICRELPRHYHAPDAHVRPWLDEQLRGGGPDELEQAIALTEPQCHLLMTVLGLLAHAYRWDSAPPRPEERQRTSLELPDRLAALWWHASRRLGVPCVGSLYHFVLSNWRLRSRPEGGRYVNGELAGENLELAFHYLLPPADREERTLFISVVESEARGAEALRVIVALLSAAAREDVHQTTYLLDKLRTEIAAISHAFATAIRKQHLKPDTFLTLIQPTHVWGLPEPRPRSVQATDVSGVERASGTRRLDGASGSQTPIMQAIDAILGLQRRSHTGQLVLEGARVPVAEAPALPRRPRRCVAGRAGLRRASGPAAADGAVQRVRPGRAALAQDASEARRAVSQGRDRRGGERIRQRGRHGARRGGRRPCPRVRGGDAAAARRDHGRLVRRGRAAAPHGRGGVHVSHARGPDGAGRRSRVARVRGGRDRPRGGGAAARVVHRPPGSGSGLAAQRARRRSSPIWRRASCSGRCRSSRTRPRRPT